MLKGLAKMALFLVLIPLSLPVTRGMGIAIEDEVVFYAAARWGITSANVRCEPLPGYGGVLTDASVCTVRGGGVVRRLVCRRYPHAQTVCVEPPTPSADGGTR